MQTLTEKDRKRILRYCICPKVAMAALIMAFVLPFLILPFEMIDDMVFHHKGFQQTGMFCALALTVIEVVIFCYCTLAPRPGMRSKKGRELQSKLAVAQSEQTVRRKSQASLERKRPRACSSAATTKAHAT